MNKSTVVIIIVMFGVTLLNAYLVNQNYQLSKELSDYRDDHELIFDNDEILQSHIDDIWKHIDAFNEDINDVYWKMEVISTSNNV